jgi:hypothetical protein
MSPRSARLSSRERVWLPLEYVRTIGPLRGVTVEGLRAALIGLHANDPTHPLVCRLDRQRARWVPMTRSEFAAFHRGAVGESVVGAGDGGPEALTQRLLDEPRGWHPIRILLDGPYVAMKASHAMGDADPVNRLLRAVVLAAANGRAGVPPPLTTSRLALTRALARHFGRDPRRLVAGLRINRPPSSPPLGEGQGVTWAPRLAVRSARSTAALAQLRIWRDAYAPGVSTAALTFAAFNTALFHCGLASERPGAVVLTDARRYLPAGLTAGGNFCWGPYLEPDSLLDPRAIHQALRSELATGRIMTMMALRECRLALTGAPGMPAPYPTRVRRDPQPELTFGNQGRHDVLADLPWDAAPGERVNMSAPTLSAPEGIVLSTSEMAETLHIDVTFHASTFDPDLLGRAVDLVCHDPIGLITASR